MPIYMDVHIVPGVKAKDVAEAHRKDLLHQEDHACKCMTYWIDEQRESIFCLIEAPDKTAVEEMHRKAHGLIPNKVIEVSNDLVESFLGRIYDPSNATVTGDGLKIFEDPSYRFLLVTTITDPVLLQHRLGKEKTIELLNYHNTVTRKNISRFEGREAEQKGTGFVISFSSASKSIACAQAIQNEMQGIGPVGLRMAINAGEPVEHSNTLFGDTIELATQLCFIVRELQIGITSPVMELASKDPLLWKDDRILNLSAADEAVLTRLFAGLEEKWQDANFDMDDYCQSMAMSKSQLYRKAISLTGKSPNALLKDFRLEKAKALMKGQHYNIAQVTFDSGFTSPSYFTKCFKKKFDILPLAYLELLR